MRNSIIAFFLFNYLSFSQEIEFKGYFDYTYNTDNGKITLAVDKLDQEFLYVNSLSRGVGNNDLGLDRGQLGNSRVVYFTKKGDKIFLIQPNLKYISTSDNNLENKAVDQAFARSVLYGFKILKSENNKHHIDLTPFILQDAHGVSLRLKNSNSGSYSLDLSKSAIDLERTKAFPKNIEFDVMLTFIGNPKGSLVRNVTPTPSNLTVNQHHSFIQLPDNKYEKRRFDPRSGSNPFIVYDYSTPINEPTEQRYIVRHRLKKKNNEKEISDAVEPIVYYLDNGTPEPVKTALLEGGKWWNQAFENIGYKNAFQIKILPEDADPMDIRYNLIQWIHRSTRGWSYGASIVDPRTGEIIKGQVSLGSLRVRQDYMILLGLTENPNDEINNKKIIETSLDRIRQLSAHEIGHTLGFAHNYLSSISDRSSVMDFRTSPATYSGNAYANYRKFGNTTLNVPPCDIVGHPTEGWSHYLSGHTVDGAKVSFGNSRAEAYIIKDGVYRALMHNDPGDGSAHYENNNSVFTPDRPIPNTNESTDGRPGSKFWPNAKTKNANVPSISIGSMSPLGIAFKNLSMSIDDYSSINELRLKSIADDITFIENFNLTNHDHIKDIIYQVKPWD